MQKKNAKNAIKFEKFQSKKIKKQAAKKLKGGIVTEDIIM